MQHHLVVLRGFQFGVYGCMFCLCIVLVVSSARHRQRAFHGDPRSARSILIPALLPLLWILTAATGAFTLYFCALEVSNSTPATKITSLSIEAHYSGQQFALVLAMVFVLQPSVAPRSMQYTVGISILLATYTMPIAWYMTEYGHTGDLYAVLTISRALLLVLFMYILVHPPPRASKYILREYSVFAFVYYAFRFSCSLCLRQGEITAAFNLMYGSYLLGMFIPLMNWRVLTADTEFWRALGQRACALQRLFRQQQSQHQQIQDRVSAQGMPLLVELQPKYVIDFPYLERKQRIGVGTNSVVFNGFLQSSIAVAIKQYTPLDFTEDMVAEFSDEAALCAALNHPNIVNFYGLCVCPPMIALVTELCQGSLSDVTCAIMRRGLPKQRCQLVINLTYMIDAARAVAHLHSFTPAFVHGDLNPASFLVDVESNVKLADLGDSRSLSRESVVPNPVQGASPGSPKSRRVEYMAPEIIQGPSLESGECYNDEAADVFALAMTMWDIMNPGVDKYPEATASRPAAETNRVSRHVRVIEMVLEGKRPYLDEHMHPSLLLVIESAWQSDPRLRPSAQNIVSILASIQEEELGAFATQFTTEFYQELPLQRKKCSDAVLPRSFDGRHAVKKLKELEYVACTHEAIRMGNAFMDAGLLHHARHARCFTYSDALYYFDEDSIQRSHESFDVRASEAGKRFSAVSSAVSSVAGKGSVVLGRDSYDIILGTPHYKKLGTSSHLDHRRRLDSSQTTVNDDFNLSAATEQPLLPKHGICACRKYGQRLEYTKISRRRLRRQFQELMEGSDLTTKLLTDEASPVDPLDVLEARLHAVEAA